MSREAHRAWPWALAIVLLAGALGAYLARDDAPVEAEPSTRPAASSGRSRLGTPSEIVSPRDALRRDEGALDAARGARRGVVGETDPSAFSPGRALVTDGGVPGVLAVQRPPMPPESGPSEPEPAEPRIVEVEPESALEMAETIQRVVTVQLEQAREELAQARAAGRTQRAARIAQRIRELEAGQPAIRTGVERLQREVESAER